MVSLSIMFVGTYHLAKNSKNSQGKNQVVQQFSGNSIRKLRKERKRRTDRREVPFLSQREVEKLCTISCLLLPLPVSSACARKLTALRITAALCRCSFCGKKSPTLETLLLKSAKVKLIAGNIIVRCIFFAWFIKKKKTCKQINLSASRLRPFASKPFRTKILILQSSDSLSAPFEMITHIP